jgi:hypothetical protein
MCEEEQCAKTRERRTHVDTDVDSPHEPEPDPGAELEAKLKNDRVGARAARGRESNACIT